MRKVHDSIKRAYSIFSIFIFLSLMALFCLVQHNDAIAQTGIITTVAGNGEGGFIGDGGPATEARIDRPVGVSVNSSGDIYIGDTWNYRIRKVDGSTGIITTVAGSGEKGFFGDGGPATEAELYRPEGLFTNNSGDIYIADRGNNRIRKVDGATGIITTVAGAGFSALDLGDGGPATDAKLSSPKGVFVNNSGDIYIADSSQNRIRKVDGITGIITTVAGNGLIGFRGDGGPATEARLTIPNGVFVDSSGDIYIADTQNNRIRKVDGSTGIITTVAGNGESGFFGDGGSATAANMSAPIGVSVDSSGDIYFSDTGNTRIRKVDGSTGIITTVAGNGESEFSGDGGPATAAGLGSPRGIFLDSRGDIYIADGSRGRGCRIRKVSYEGVTILDIKANGSNVPITLGTSEMLSVSISLIAGSNIGVDCDWWVAESAPDGWYYYSLATSWTTAGSSYTNLLPTHQGALFDLNTYEVLNTSGLSIGTHTYYFAIDTNRNGSLDMGSIYYDSVVVNITQ